MDDVRTYIETCNDEKKSVKQVKKVILRNIDWEIEDVCIQTIVKH